MYPKKYDAFNSIDSNLQSHLTHQFFVFEDFSLLLLIHHNQEMNEAKRDRLLSLLNPNQ